MSPITPAKIYDGRLAIQLPREWMAAFLYLSEISLTRPEVAAFPTYFLSAFGGNPDALKKVLEVGLIAHWTAIHHAKTEGDRSIANAIIYLNNQLAEMIERSELPTYAETPSQAPSTNPESAPFKKAEAKQPKPTRKFDRKIQFVKPGTSRQES